jgi:hypothetical protein
MLLFAPMRASRSEKPKPPPRTPMEPTMLIGWRVSHPPHASQ